MTVRPGSTTARDTYAESRKTQEQRAAAKPAGRREPSIRVMLFPAEKKSLEDYARKQGLETSTWLRQLGLRKTGYLPDENG